MLGGNPRTAVGVPSPFFPGIRIFSGNHQKRRGSLKRMMVEKNGELVPRTARNPPLLRYMAHPHEFVKSKAKGIPVWIPTKTVAIPTSSFPFVANKLSKVDSCRKGCHCYFHHHPFEPFRKGGLPCHFHHHPRPHHHRRPSTPTKYWQFQ